MTVASVSWKMSLNYQLLVTCCIFGEYSLCVIDPVPQREVVRDVVHYWYTAWPDHGVPETSDEMLDFILASRRARDSASMPGPVVVHCRWGVAWYGAHTLTHYAIPRVLAVITTPSFLHLVYCPSVGKGGKNYWIFWKHWQNLVSLRTFDVDVCTRIRTTVLAHLIVALCYISYC